jgi:hypothetical protein
VFKVTNNADPGPRTDVELVTTLMLEDYERVIFYLLRRLGKDLDAIMVVMRKGEEEHTFPIKKPFEQQTSLSHVSGAKRIDNSTPHVHRIEYQEYI